MHSFLVFISSYQISTSLSVPSLLCFPKWLIFYATKFSSGRKKTLQSLLYSILSNTSFVHSLHNPENMYLLQVNNRNNKKRCERQPCSGAFIVNFEHISHLFLIFLLFTLNRLMLAWNIWWNSTASEASWWILETISRNWLKKNILRIEKTILGGGITVKFFKNISHKVTAYMFLGCHVPVCHVSGLSCPCLSCSLVCHVFVCHVPGSHVPLFLLETNKLHFGKQCCHAKYFVEPKWKALFPELNMYY